MIQNTITILPAAMQLVGADRQTCGKANRRIFKNLL